MFWKSTVKQIGIILNDSFDVAHLNPFLVIALRKKLGFEEGCKICKRCGSSNATTSRQMTKYADDNDNFVTLCPTCQEEADEYWKDMWIEYYNSQGL